MTPLSALTRGALAGIAGTALMTAWQELAAKLPSNDDQASSGSEPPADPWERASAPAKVAKRVGESVFQVEVPADKITLLTNVMHWGYGTSWGTVYGALAGSARRTGGLKAGAAFGTGVWAMSYIQLVPMGLYETPWKYPVKTLALDLSYHLAYGAGVAGAYRLLTR